MNNVILINIEHFTRNRDRMFFITRLRKDGINARVWDLSFLSKWGIEFPDVIVDDYIDILSSYKEIKDALDKVNVEETFFIVQVPFYNETHKLYKYLKNKGCYIAFFNYYTNTFDVPTYHVELVSPFRTPLLLIKKLSTKIGNYLKWRFYQFYWKGIRYNCYLSPIDANNVTGHINHPDYNDFTFCAEDRLIETPFFVFCDNYFPYHPDLINKVKGIDGKKYQLEMCSLFDEIEHRTGFPVIIAAHPKAVYNNGEFGGRKIIKYKTNNLVTYSEGVIFHSSNSISYAIMANKKIMCVTTNDYNTVDTFKPYLEYLCHYFNIKLNNLDEKPLSEINFENVSKEVREKYIYSFLTHKDCEDRDNYSIIKEVIQNAHI